MHIEDVEEDADASLRGSSDGHGGDIGDFAISGRNDGTGLGGDLTLGVTEKPEEKRGQQEQWNGVRPSRQPSYEGCREERAHAIEISVTHHRRSG
jgi:hypothetical protein